MCKKIIIFMITLCTIATTLSGCYLFPQEEEVLAPPLIEPTEITYDVIEVKKGDIEKRITGTGTFVSTHQEPIFFKNRGGRFKKYHVKLGDEVEKGQIIAELTTDNIETDIKRQEIALKKARINYQRTKNSGGDKYALQMANLDIELAQITLEDLKRELEEAKLYAAIGGKVTYLNNNLSPGDYINAYDSIAYIADPTSIILGHTGSNVSDFKVGMEVEVKIKDDLYKGEVVATPANAPKDADERLKDAVLIDVEDLPEEIGMGDQASIALILEKRENVLVIPKRVVHNYMGRRFVKILEDDIRKERDVEIGVETPTEVEILKGLEAGEKVIVQ